MNSWLVIAVAIVLHFFVVATHIFIVATHGIVRICINVVQNVFIVGSLFSTLLLGTLRATSSRTFNASAPMPAELSSIFTASSFEGAATLMICPPSRASRIRDEIKIFELVLAPKSPGSPTSADTDAEAKRLLKVAASTVGLPTPFKEPLSASYEDNRRQIEAAEEAASAAAAAPPPS